MRIYEFYCYITTNPSKTVLYIGATNNIEQRLTEHYFNKKTFAGKYQCYNLLYFEFHQYVSDAFSREIRLKGWSRKRKIALVEAQNPDWKFLNSEVMRWPPKEGSEVRG